MKSKYRFAQHAGGLNDCLKTEIEIPKITYILVKPFYKFYGYDNREAT